MAEPTYSWMWQPTYFFSKWTVTKYHYKKCSGQLQMTDPAEDLGMYLITRLQWVTRVLIKHDVILAQGKSKVFPIEIWIY